MKNFIINIGLWLLIFTGLISFFAFRLDFEQRFDYYKHKMLSVLIPEYSWQEQGRIVVARQADNHFYLKGYVGRKPIRFLVDTGATAVALSAKDAAKLGFDVNMLDYTIETKTASGTVYSAKVHLPNLNIGGLNLENVIAYVTRNGLETSLLGMSVIGRFKNVSISRSELIFDY